MFQWITENPFGPHHCFMRSGSVNAFHTRSRGASSTRERTKSALLVSAVVMCSPGFRRASGFPVGHHHPGDAEAVAHHAEAWRKERGGERHLHLTAVSETVEELL